MPHRSVMALKRSYGVWTMDKLQEHIREYKMLGEEGPDWHLEKDEISSGKDLHSVWTR